MEAVTENSGKWEITTVNSASQMNSGLANGESFELLNEKVTGHFFPCEEILSAAFVLFYSRTIGLCSLLESTKV
ncbi:MAG: hypothetical protein ACLTG0_17570 [Oscillibacter sp.]